jgi:putative ABC transport system substrate-binding protein
MLITLAPESSRMAAQRGKAIPLVAFTGIAPPTSLGLGKTSEHPEAKATGTVAPLLRSTIVASASACVPKDKRRLGVVFDPGDPVSVAVMESLKLADRDGLSPPPDFEVAEAKNAAAIPVAVEGLAKRGATAMILVPGEGLDDLAVIKTATRLKLPVFGFSEIQAKAGALVVREPELRWAGFETGRRAGKVLKGADPQTLPFMEGSVFTTIANPTVGKQIGVTIRGELLRGAVMLP